MKKIIALILAASSGLGTSSSVSYAGPDPFIGEIILFGGNFCPRGYVPAEGQLLKISNNTALFSLYGTIYGVDGRTTFGIPDLRSRAAVGGSDESGHLRLGEKAPRTTQERYTNLGVGHLAIKYCVATDGTYPSRN